MYRDGYYGFAEPLEFRSVIELVEFYTRNSLQPYSHKLDITLQEPVSRLNAYEVENEGALGSIEEVCLNMYMCCTCTCTCTCTTMSSLTVFVHVQCTCNYTIDLYNSRTPL